MKAIIHWNEKKYQADFSNPLDLSIPMRNGSENPNAFHIPHPRFEPIRVGDFVGSVAAGSGANCENLLINAHGNGTHTECIGHITPERISINQSLKNFHCIAQLLDVRPIQSDQGDWIVPVKEIEGKILSDVDAVILRTLPNEVSKLTRFYSGKNPVYLSPEVCTYMASLRIKHILVDIPSVDREEDSGAMLAHKAFWQYPENPRWDATISELLFIPDQIPEGIFLLNIQIASLETDASPSKPVVYELIPQN